MFIRWIPWKFIVKRAARAYGFIDPLLFLARLRQFSRPSEVQEPIELVRAGIVFHTRGLINTKAIQHNLDWVWPYWVERQFNPNDTSFIPRAFSFSHVNLTHRNWTAVGHPDVPEYPIVDPRGLVTPLYDGWSIDFWVLGRQGQRLLPSQLEEIDQQLILKPNLAVRTRASHGGITLQSQVQLKSEGGSPVAAIRVNAAGLSDGWLVVALRPYNPEGVQFIEKIETVEQWEGWQVNGNIPIRFSQEPEKVLFSNYEESDVLYKLDEQTGPSGISCSVGMATSAACFPLAAVDEGGVEITVPLEFQHDGHGKRQARSVPRVDPEDAWEEMVKGTAKLVIPDTTIQFLYDAAVRTMILLSAEDIVPGPYTYKRFWFRDACLMLNSLLATGLTERAGKIIKTFPDLQKISGYFQSQEGEWDSNGQVLWIVKRYLECTGEPLDAQLLNAVMRGAKWICRKRLPKKAGLPHSGLLPAGFSAEHLGPNDYYYWDAFWSLAGLKSAAHLAKSYGAEREERLYGNEAADLEGDIWASIETISEHRARGAIPASPYRRLDAGAIGSMVADYPLQLTPRGDRRIMKTADFLIQNCFHEGAFFQDMIHSGSNAYLTLDVAQTLLRSGDMRFRKLVDAVARLASPTGQWPEAIHPLTQGGCMGDGQHGWAAAEWLFMIRNMFVREEKDMLILAEGVMPRWLKPPANISFGPTPTRFGRVSVAIEISGKNCLCRVKLVSHPGAEMPASMVLRVPGYEEHVCPGQQECTISLQEKRK